jgi:hypothetical protein
MDALRIDNVDARQLTSAIPLRIERAVAYYRVSHREIRAAIGSRYRRDRQTLYFADLSAMIPHL